MGRLIGMVVGLSVNNIVQVNTTWQEATAQTRNFGALLIVGRAGVLSDTESLREYTSLQAVSADFSQTSCEYQAAEVFFAQSPQPSVVYIGAWQSAETPTQCFNRLRSASMAWYAMFFALDGSTNSPLLTPAQLTNVSNAVQASSVSSLLLVNTQENTVSSGSTTDTASTLPDNSRTIFMYSESSLYAVCGLFGKFATVDYTGTNTVKTAAFATLSGVTADDLTNAQAQSLTSKNVNYFAQYNVGASFIMPSVTMSGQNIKAIIGIDAFVNDLQVTLIDYLQQKSETGFVPYDEEGISQLHGQLCKVGKDYVTNGLLAPNKQWTFSSVGALQSGSILKSGYYFYFSPLTDVTIEQIQAGQAPVCTACVNLAGEIKSITVNLYVGV